MGRYKVLLIVRKMIWAIILVQVICGSPINSCNLGSREHKEKSADGKLKVRCCKPVPCDRGMSPVLCEVTDEFAQCRDCPAGSFQPRQAPSYIPQACMKHRVCFYSKGLAPLKNGTAVSDAVCVCDINRRYVSTKEYNKNPDGLLYKLERNPESCSETKCSALKLDGENIVCVHDKPTTPVPPLVLNTSTQTPLILETPATPLFIKAEPSGNNNYAMVACLTVVGVVVVIIVLVLVLKKRTNIFGRLSSLLCTTNSQETAAEGLLDQKVTGADNNLNLISPSSTSSSNLAGDTDETPVKEIYEPPVVTAAQNLPYDYRPDGAPNDIALKFEYDRNAGGHGGDGTGDYNFVNDDQNVATEGHPVRINNGGTGGTHYHINGGTHYLGEYEAQI